MKCLVCLNVSVCRIPFFKENLIMSSISGFYSELSAAFRAAVYVVGKSVGYTKLTVLKHCMYSECISPQLFTSRALAGRELPSFSDAVAFL